MLIVGCVKGQKELQCQSKINKMLKAQMSFIV